MTKVVIPLTGGMDSSYMVYKALNMGLDVYPLIFDDSYGGYSMRDKTIKPAIRVLQQAGLAHKVHIIPFFPTNVHKLSDEHYGYTPGRNMLIAMSSVAYAEFVGADEVWLGFNASQEGFYPDQNQKMFDDISNLYESVYNFKVTIVLPLLEMTRKEVVIWGTQLGVPFEETVSCVNTPISVNCGKCNRCKERKEAFKSAGIPDKTIYYGD